MGKSQDAGRDAESRAEALLRHSGLNLVARNYRRRGGEIDLIMRDAQHLVFVEVRQRGSVRFGGALSSVDANKQRRVIHAAQHHLMSSGWQGRAASTSSASTAHNSGDNGFAMRLPRDIDRRQLACDNLRQLTTAATQHWDPIERINALFDDNAHLTSSAAGTQAALIALAAQCIVNLPSRRRQGIVLWQRRISGRCPAFRRTDAAPL